MDRDKEKYIVNTRPIGFFQSMKLRLKGASEARRHAIEIDEHTQMATSATIMELVSETYHAIGIERRKLIKENSTNEEELINRENDIIKIEENDNLDISEKWLKMKRLRTEIDYYNGELKKTQAEHYEIIFMHHEMLYRKLSIYWRAAIKKDESLPAQPRIYTPLAQKEEWIRSRYLDGRKEGIADVENF